MSTAAADKHEFQAEIKQLLDIVIHSLYTDKEIFLRELVSNASDALEKMRHLQLSEKNIFDDNLPLEINISTDDKAGTITIQDFGIGLTRDELKENLGTIAHSGTKAFLEALKEGGTPSESLIGQFGVGFYSAFMVAKEVKVYTHSWKEDAEHLIWSSTGAGHYEVESSEGQRRGCKIVIELKDDAKEFALADKVKGILEKYSSFVTFPIQLNGDKINSVEAIWLKNKSEISEEQYTEFYKYQATAFDEPMFKLHFNADAPISINSLLFVPSTNPEQWGMGRVETGVSLYCKNVMIDAKPDGLLPEWLRFMKGVVDSADLPLNISRESMQDSALVQKLRKVLTKRLLKMLESEANKNPESYKKFYSQFSMFIKEGIATDLEYREPLGKLLRYESSYTEKGSYTSLADYVSRMKEGQKDIYYLHALERRAIEEGPYLEAFKARGIEVLYLYEPLDEFVMTHLNAFDEKRLVAADQDDIELEANEQSDDRKALSDEQVEGLSKWMSEQLGEKVGAIKGGKRLVDSPILALNTDKMMTPSMRRIMKQMNQGGDAENMPKMDLEINTKHKLIKNLDTLREADPDRAKAICEQLYDTAMMAAGLVEDPRSLVTRMNSILEYASEPKADS